MSILCCHLRKPELYPWNSQIQIIVHCCRSHNRRSRLVYSAWPCSISNGLASRDAKWTRIPWDRVLLNVNWVKKISTAVLKIRLGRCLLLSEHIIDFFKYFINRHCHKFCDGTAEKNGHNIWKRNNFLLGILYAWQ